jgi:hypothetical protein
MTVLCAILDRYDFIVQQELFCLSHDSLIIFFNKTVRIAGDFSFCIVSKIWLLGNQQEAAGRGRTAQGLRGFL